MLTATCGAFLAVTITGTSTAAAGFFDFLVGGL
jgi:hypothetical protein